ncbi:MAG TPA: mevalonate kinase [Candidatus Nitrosopolaris sp.]|nr:mevalonate kinase [Candidatus Nitrosopolaris sp.]
MRLRKSSARASAPGKVVLFGEHFVIYDNPAILAAIDRRVNVTVCVNTAGNIKITSDIGLVGSFEDSRFHLLKGTKAAKTILAPLCECARLILSERGCNVGLDIELESNLPESVGLGSSAACCVAITAAVDSLFHQPDKQWVCAKAAESERLIHKDSSGADCNISTFGGMMYFVKSEGFRNIYSKKELSLVIINTGKKHSTANLVTSVRKFKDINRFSFKVLASLSNTICQNAFAAIKEGNEQMLGNLMSQNHVLLQEIGVSDKVIDELVGLCLTNGAWGAKLTGAGGGGSIVVLVPPNEDRLRVFLDGIGKNECVSESIPVKIDYNGVIVT